MTMKCQLKGLCGQRCGKEISSTADSIVSHVQMYHVNAHLFSCSHCVFASYDFKAFVEHCLDSDHEIILEPVLRHAGKMLPDLLTTFTAIQRQFKFQRRPVKGELDQSVLPLDETADTAPFTASASTEETAANPSSPPELSGPVSSSRRPATANKTPARDARNSVRLPSFSGAKSTNLATPHHSKSATHSRKRKASTARTPSSIERAGPLLQVAGSALTNLRQTSGQTRLEAAPINTSEEMAEEERRQKETKSSDASLRKATCRFCTKTLVLWYKDRTQDPMVGLRFDQLESHMESNHYKKQLRLLCSQCNLVLPSQGLIKKHWKKQHPESDTRNSSRLDFHVPGSREEALEGLAETMLKAFPELGPCRQSLKNRYAALQLLNTES